MSRAGKAGKSVKELTKQELISELIRTQVFLSGPHHPSCRKSMQKRLREINQRLKDMKMNDIKNVNLDGEK